MKKLIKAAFIAYATGMVAVTATVFSRVGREEFGNYLRETSVDRPIPYGRFVLAVFMYTILWPVTLPLAVRRIKEER